MARPAKAERYDKSKIIHGFSRPFRMLIAEDCPDNQHLMALRFSHPLLHIEFAHDGRECVEKALEAKEQGLAYDIVIVDVLMPVLDGFSAGMLIKENECCEILISVTERGMFCDESESRQAGCDFHFTKTSMYRKLIPCLEETLGFDSGALLAH